MLFSKCQAETSGVIELLKSWPERKREIAVLRFELQKFTGVRENEILEAMALTHGDSIGRPGGRISDKTLYIALSYQRRADEMNSEAKEAIVTGLVGLAREQERLEYYVSLFLINGGSNMTPHNLTVNIFHRSLLSTSLNF